MLSRQKCILFANCEVSIYLNLAACSTLQYTARCEDPNAGIYRCQNSSSLMASAACSPVVSSPSCPWHLLRPAAWHHYLSIFYMCTASYLLLRATIVQISYFVWLTLVQGVHTVHTNGTWVRDEREECSSHHTGNYARQHM